jgi:hypothetical protein
MASFVRSCQLVFKIYFFYCSYSSKKFIKGHESAFRGRENDFRGRENDFRGRGSACKESRVTLEAVSILEI